MSSNPVEIRIEEALLANRAACKENVPVRIRLGIHLYTTWALWWMEWADRQLVRRGVSKGEIPAAQHRYGGLPILLDESIPPREFAIDTHFQGANP